MKKRDLSGRIVRIPKGTPVTFEEDRGVEANAWRRPVKKIRSEAFVVVTHDSTEDDHDHGEPTVAFETAAGLWRWVPRDQVEVAVDEDHRLYVGGRRIIGGSPIKQGGNVYATSARCACGARFKGSTAVEVRQDWRSHVSDLVEYGAFEVKPDRYDTMKPESIWTVTMHTGLGLDAVQEFVRELPVGKSVTIEAQKYGKPMKVRVKRITKAGRV